MRSLSLDKLAAANYNDSVNTETVLKGVLFMMPLGFSEIGEAQIVRRIGGTPEVKKHLENLGFVAGSEVSIISKLGSNVIVKVKESRVAISDELARKIMVG